MATQGVTLRSAYATNDSRAAPAIMAAARKVAKTGTAAASYSRWRLPYQAPLIPATDGQSLACAGLSPRFMKHAMRLAAVPRASYAADSRWLSQA
jgi:hypothetical protein